MGLVQGWVRFLTVVFLMLSLYAQPAERVGWKITHKNVRVRIELNLLKLKARVVSAKPVGRTRVNGKEFNRVVNEAKNKIENAARGFVAGTFTRLLAAFTPFSEETFRCVEPIRVSSILPEHVRGAILNFVVNSPSRINFSCSGGENYEGFELSTNQDQICLEVLIKKTAFPQIVQVACGISGSPINRTLYFTTQSEPTPTPTFTPTFTHTLTFTPTNTFTPTPTFTFTPTFTPTNTPLETPTPTFTPTFTFTPTYTFTPTFTHTPTFTPTKTFTPTPTFTFTPTHTFTPTPTNTPIQRSQGDWGLDGFSTSLERYSGVWTREKAAHLLNKIGFGATKEELDRAMALGLDAFVDQIVEDCDFRNPASRINRIESEAQYHRDRARSGRYHCTRLGCYIEDRTQRFNGQEIGYRFDGFEAQTNYLYYHFLNGSPVCAAMWIIWHNWFALNISTLDSNLYPALGGDYIDAIFRNLVGDFKQLVKDMHKNPHMLLWLDNYLNRRQKVRSNQNYARELLELFTMKVFDLMRFWNSSDQRLENYANYTEQDIEHLTRALVGYQEIIVGATTRTQNGQRVCSLPSNLPPYGPPVRVTCEEKRFCLLRRVEVSRISRDNNNQDVVRDNSIRVNSGSVYFEGAALNREENCVYRNVYTERRFAFNETEWQHIGGREDSDFQNGVRLFNGLISGTDLNINSFVDDTQGYLIRFNDNGNVNNRPTNPVFYASAALRDNLTDRILQEHGFVAGDRTGSSTSRAIAIQLLGFFVSQAAARNIPLVAELSDLIYRNNFNLKPVLKTLLKSEVMFSPEHAQKVVKTPLEHMVTMFRANRLPLDMYASPNRDWFALIERVNEGITMAGFPNLRMPSVFGVPVAGTQRNDRVFDGSGFLNPFNTRIRQNTIGRYMSLLHTYIMRGPNPAWTEEEISARRNNELYRVRIKTIHPEDQYPEIDKYLPKQDPWANFGDSSALAYWVTFGERYGSTNPYFFQFYSPYSGRRFSYYDHLRNDFNNIDDPVEVIKETAMRHGVRLSPQQVERLREFFVRLRLSDANNTQLSNRDCWPNFSNHTQNGLSISAQEVKRRYFDGKYSGLIWILMNLPDAWLK